MPQHYHYIYPLQNNAFYLYRKIPALHHRIYPAHLAGPLIKSPILHPLAKQTPYRSLAQAHHLSLPSLHQAIHTHTHTHTENHAKNSPKARVAGNNNRGWRSRGGPYATKRNDKTGGFFFFSFQQQKQEKQPKQKQQQTTTTGRSA